MKIRYYLLSILTAVTVSCAPTDQTDQNHIGSNSNKVVPSLELNDLQTGFREQVFDAYEKYEADDSANGMKRYFAQMLSMAGREDIPFDDGVTRNSPNICTSLEGVSKDDSLKTLVDLIGQNTLVIINEDHSQPRDRAFIFGLLKELKSHGFTHYAAETFNTSFNANLNGTNETFSSITDGHYSNEPVFGRLVTYAKEAGFTLIPYEQIFDPEILSEASMDEKIDARENAQSDNLINAVLKDAPDTKMLIHVGHSHVAEKPVPKRGGGAREWMAAFLKSKTGIDPLTISQTACHTKANSTIVGQSFQNKEDEIGLMLTDYVVAHPSTEFIKNRPLWRREIGDKEHSIPNIFLESPEPLIVEARLDNQPDKAVPIDRVLIRPGETGVPLLLPSGRYRLEAFSKEGRFSEPILTIVD